MARKLFLAVLFLAIFLSSEGFAKKGEVKQYGVPVLSRDVFNQQAVIEGYPLFWNEDSNRSGTIEAKELIPVGAGSALTPYVENGKLTEAFKEAYLRMVEARREELVDEELNAGRPTLVTSDFRRAPAAERNFVERIVRAAGFIDELYQIQKGGFKYFGDIPKDDFASFSLFYRNMGPWCEAPRTEDDPHCNAIATFPPKISDAYPEDLQKMPNMCEKLAKKKNAKELLDPFTAVRNVKGRLVGLPLTEVYGDRMSDVAAELRAAAEALGDDEAAFRGYLLAAAKGFETNDWAEADEAWVSMNARNSKWYLRVAPDETYFDPCSEKAGFHLAFAKIDPGSLKWQDKLNPLTGEMEGALADLSGGAYRAREVHSEFPDFIEIILNSGDSRHNLGAVIGQSLPNWGKVADEGRRRTVVMTNLYTDPDSKRIEKEKARALLDPESMKYFPEDEEIGLVDIILHEATHNFGPHSDYKIDGKSVSEIFGGKTQSTLEELKVQTGALWYLDFLRKKGILSEKQVKEAYTHAVNWCFGHISRGMFTAGGNPKPYSQLSAIQVGSLVNDGAMSFVSSTDPASGETMDRFKIDYDKFPAAVENLMKKVVTIYANGDAAGAKELIDNYVTGEDSRLVHMKDIADRILKFPKASFYYSVQY